MGGGIGDGGGDRICLGLVPVALATGTLTTWLIGTLTAMAFVLVERIGTLQFDTVVVLAFIYDPVEPDKNGLCNS